MQRTCRFDYAGLILAAMESPLVIIVAVDGWRARSLGAYGNTFYGTAELDRFASQSVVFEQFLVESNSVAEVYDSLWTGRHLLSGNPLPPHSIIGELRSAGFQCELVTDEPEVSSHQLAKEFDHVHQAEPAPVHTSEDALATSFARVLEEAANVAGEWASEYEQPRLMWVHLRGFTAPWDAPGELAESLVDEDDPDLPPSTDVPQCAITDSESDEAFLASCRYGGQVMALDQCFGAFDRLITELWPDSRPQVALCGTRGFALGEHGVLGIANDAHSQQYHTPLMLRTTTEAALQRHCHLVQSSDIASMLRELAGIDTSPQAIRKLASARASSGDRFLRTQSWHYVQPDNKQPKLFVKPDDLWEANDVASLCPAELTQFAQLDEQLEKLASSGKPWSHLALPSEPVNPA